MPSISIHMPHGLDEPLLKSPDSLMSTSFPSDTKSEKSDISVICDGMFAPSTQELEKAGEKKAGEEKTKKISTTFALINLLKGMCGPGCFALPIAFKQAGLWSGMVLVALLGIISVICMNKLVKCSQFLCKKNNIKTLDYAQMAEEAFGSSFPWLRRFRIVGSLLVNICLLLLQLGICCVFYIFVVEHCQEIVNHFWPDNGISRTAYFYYVFPAFILLSTVRSIKVISWICLFGNVFMVYSLGVILYVLTSSKHIPTTRLPAITDVNGLMLSAGSILYALEGQALVLPLENKMQEPKAMGGVTGVLSTGVSLVSLIYMGCGFFGYITYGENVKPSITLNLDDSPVNFSVKCTLLAVVFFGFLIQQFPIVEMIWPSVKNRLKNRGVDRKWRIAAEYGFRYAIVAVAFGLSLVIPDLDSVIPLVGVTSGMMLALVLPALCDTITFLPVWLENKEPLWKMIAYFGMNGVYFVLGLFFVITGFEANINQLIHPDIVW